MEMDNRERVSGLFQSIVTDLGFQIVLGDNHLRNIQRKSMGEELIIELPNNDEMLSVYAPSLMKFILIIGTIFF
jgi:hypothetical protein